MAKTGEKIQQVRRQRRMTQAELAAMVGVSQGHISNIERGVTSDMGTVERICSALDLDVKSVLLESLGIVDEWETKILNDPALRADDRTLLVSIYKIMRGRGPLGDAGG